MMETSTFHLTPVQLNLNTAERDAHHICPLAAEISVRRRLLVDLWPYNVALSFERHATITQ